MSPPKDRDSNFENNFQMAQSDQTNRSFALDPNLRQFAKGRVLVIPKAGLPELEFSNILNKHHGKARKLGQSHLYIVDDDLSIHGIWRGRLKWNFSSS